MPDATEDLLSRSAQAVVTARTLAAQCKRLKDRNAVLRAQSLEACLTLGVYIRDRRVQKLSPMGMAYLLTYLLRKAGFQAVVLEPPADLAVRA